MRRPLIQVPILLLFCLPCFSQGRVVINEFMPWTSNTCGGPTAEFVELLNFGPGPVDIGCYVLTDGDYSITIPPNTLLQPGEFYVISGQDVITVPCANIDSTIVADLNWNSCNCTSGPIPTTGDGLFTDGGSASEQVVLLDPALNVVDAVVRTLPVEPSALITTSTNFTGCTSQSFNLDLMNINYETIGESAGRGNSFARKLDGDCGWVKDPQQSGGATNNTPSETSSVDYDFAVTNTMACSADGSVAVIVNASNYSDIFPVTYTLAYDSDHDNIFELDDSYVTGVESNPNMVSIGGLLPGRYRLTIGSSLGCFLQTFPFVILNCAPVLPLNLRSFTARRSGEGLNIYWTIENAENLQRLSIEQSSDGIYFHSIATIPLEEQGLWQSSHLLSSIDPATKFIRLAMLTQAGMVLHSHIVTVEEVRAEQIRIGNNPSGDVLRLEIAGYKNTRLGYSILNVAGMNMMKGDFTIGSGIEVQQLSIHRLPPGTYIILLTDAVTKKSESLRFVKLY